MKCFILATVFGVCVFSPALAYFDKTDVTEAYTILPNESAFWIPDVGDNKSSQGQLDSESYYNDKKIAQKRFQIPHQKLSGSAGNSLFSGYDYYVPTGRLILVDRTPYSREWVKSTARGTSKDDESFPCQSSEGLNITIGVSIGASISETNAAKYLYRYGTLPPTVRAADGQTYYADRKDPQTIFTSVYYGRKLEDVMDAVVRKKVQTLVCREISMRTFDKANAEAAAILDNVTKEASNFLSADGITLEFLGYADTWTFDPDVQKAINDRYTSVTLQQFLPVLQTLAEIKVQEGLGAGLASHGPPIVITPGFVDGILNFVKQSTGK